MPPDVTDTELSDLMRPPLIEQPTPQYMFGSQNIGPTAIRAGTGVLGGVIQGFGGPVGSLGSMATTALGEDLAQKAEIYEGIREAPDLNRVGIAGLAGAVPFPALRTASPVAREVGQAAFNTTLPAGMVAAENLAEGRPQSGAELGTAAGLGLLTHGAFRGLGALAPKGRASVEIEGSPFQQALGPDAGAAVYHGTGHTWPPEPGFPYGRPTLEKVRTGTGGMSQGYGFYVAQAEGTGKYYQDVLSEGADIHVGGQKIEPDSFVQTSMGNRTPQGQVAQSLSELATQYNKVHSDPKTAVNAMVKRLRSDLEKSIAYPMYSDQQKAFWKQELEVLKEFASKGIEAKPKSNLYTLDLPDEHLEKMLDWDAPISKQPDILAKAGVSVRDGGPNRVILSGGPFKQETVADDTGEGFYFQLSNALSPELNSTRSAYDYGKREASQYLLSKGILGNKYLDAASREKGKGTYNLVLFDPSIATPTHRNYEPVPLSTLTGTKEDLTPDFTKPNPESTTFTDVLKEWPTQNTMESPASTFPEIKPVPPHKGGVESMPTIPRTRTPRKYRSQP